MIQTVSDLAKNLIITSLSKGKQFLKISSIGHGQTNRPTDRQTKKTWQQHYSENERMRFQLANTVMDKAIFLSVGYGMNWSNEETWSFIYNEGKIITLPS